MFTGFLFMGLVMAILFILCNTVLRTNDFWYHWIYFFVAVLTRSCEIGAIVTSYLISVGTPRESIARFLRYNITQTETTGRTGSFESSSKKRPVIQKKGSNM